MRCSSSLATLVAILVAASVRSETYSNGDLVTHAGVGAGGADVSAISADSRGPRFGFNANGLGTPPGPYFLADDVTPSATWRLDRFHAFAFSVGATSANIDRAYLCVFDGEPGAGGTIIFGSLQPGINSNRFESNRFAVTSNGRPLYRTANVTSSATNTQRRIQDVSIEIASEVILQPGRTYWFAWALGVSTNPSALLESPPLAGNRGGTANGKQFFANGSPLNNGSNWGSAVLNPGNVEGTKVDFPFELEYTVVPEPGTFIALVAGLGCLASLRRRRD
ncbi:MAG TPA: PEP-CTERM sorting domain-containing protein [Fimbriimonadaceae bacterium]|nr:PEP-CTERM sorting domain-containing protein [Fimbriimonadaceae bacterium]